MPGLARLCFLVVVGFVAVNERGVLPPNVVLPALKLCSGNLRGCCLVLAIMGVI